MKLLTEKIKLMTNHPVQLMGNDNKQYDGNFQVAVGDTIPLHMNMPFFIVLLSSQYPVTHMVHTAVVYI